MFRRLFPYLVSAAVVAAIATGLFLIGSPSAERRRRVDAIRVQDLAQISRAIDLYWERLDRLPGSVQDLTAVPDARFRAAEDPASGEPYSYQAFEGSRYELCATFDDPAEQGDYGDRFWAHGAGRTCFALDARKERPR